MSLNRNPLYIAFLFAIVFQVAGVGAVKLGLPPIFETLFPMLAIIVLVAGGILFFQKIKRLRNSGDLKLMPEQQRQYLFWRIVSRGAIAFFIVTLFIYYKDRDQTPLLIMAFGSLISFVMFVGIVWFISKKAW